MPQLQLQRHIQTTVQTTTTTQQSVGFLKSTCRNWFGLSKEKKAKAINQAIDIPDLRNILNGLGLRERRIDEIIAELKRQTEIEVLEILKSYINEYHDLPTDTYVIKQLKTCTHDDGREILLREINTLKQNIESELGESICDIVNNERRLPLLSDINLKSSYPTKLVEELYSKILDLQLDNFYSKLTLGHQRLYDIAISLPNDIVDSLLDCVDYMRSVNVIPSVASAGDSTITEIIREYTRLSSSFIPGLVDAHLVNQSKLMAFVQDKLEESHFCDSNLAKCAHMQTIYVLAMQIAMLMDLSTTINLNCNKDSICRIGTAILVVTLQILHNECPILKVPKKIYSGYVGLGDLICDAPKDIRRFIPKWVRNVCTENRVTWHKELGTSTYQRMLGINGAMNMMYCFRVGNAFVKANNLNSVKNCSEIFGSLSPIPVRSEKELILKLYKEDLYKEIR